MIIKKEITKLVSIKTIPVTDKYGNDLQVGDKVLYVRRGWGAFGNLKTRLEEGVVLSLPKERVYQRTLIGFDGQSCSNFTTDAQLKRVRVGAAVGIKKGYSYVWSRQVIKLPINQVIKGGK